MRGSERVLVTQIMETVTDEEQDDDEQMALLLGQLAALDTKDLPIAEIVDFMFTTCEGSDDIWLLANDYEETWHAALALIVQNSACVSVDAVVAALRHAHELSEPEDAVDTDDDFYLGSLITLAGHLSSRFPVDVLLPFLRDERILIRRRTIEALMMMEASSPLVALLTDVSAQIRELAMTRLGWMKKLAPEQAQVLAVDPNVRVRAAAIKWLQRHQPDLALVAATQR